MRHFKKTAVCLTATILVFAACKASNTYNIKGVVEGAAAGDTIFLSTDFQNGTPQQILVTDDKGTFTFSGESNETTLYLAYLKNQPSANVPFFLEPGTISITLNREPGKSRVSGTVVNDNWQLMNDTVNMIGQKIQRIMSTMGDEAASSADQKSKMAEAENLNRQMMQTVLNTARTNITNELGYFIVSNYRDDEVMTDEVVLSLISQLPEQKQKQPDITSLKQQLEAAAKSAKGGKISDLTMPSPDGTDLSLKAEVAKHKLTVIDFWASWCGPCRQEMPNVRKLYQDFSSKGLGIVGVSLDNSDAPWKKAIKDMDMTWTHMSDLKGWQSTACSTFGVNSIPMTLVVSPDGTILARGLRGEQLQAFVAKYFE